MKEAFKIEIENALAYNDVKIVKISGELTIENCKILKQKTEAVIKEGFINLIVDLKNLNKIDGVGMLLLFNLYTKIRRISGKLIFLEVNGEIKNSFDKIGLSRVFPIFQNLGLALVNIKQKD